MLTPVIVRSPAVRPVAVQEVDIEDHLDDVVHVNDPLDLKRLPVGHERRPEDEGKQQVEDRGRHRRPYRTGNWDY